MVWHDWKTGPTADPAAADVLAAYEAAWKARKSTADCYHAGVGASSPGSNAGVRRARAVSVILAAKAILRIPDE